LIYHMTKATVAAIVTPNDDNRDIILLTKRSVPPFLGQWCLPGGHIDNYETAEEAVVREVREETGLLFESPVFLHYFNEVFPEYHFHAVALAFCGKGIGSIELMADEVEEIAWFPLVETLTRPLAFNHLQILQYYAKRLPF
jgi:8-oxo-dGTP diphosphatase